MRLNFKQGLVEADKDISDLPNYITTNGGWLMINTANSPVTIALGHGDTDYLHSENSNIDAWLIPASPTWLYWDIDQVTAARTFGKTTLEPVHGPSQPVAPVDDQHWFNNSTNIMYVFSSSLSRWMPRVRVFAGKYDTGVMEYFPFGSQVATSANTLMYTAGRIMYDVTGSAIQRPDGSFLTTEDEIRINGTLSQGVRLEANTTQAKANEAVPAFSVVAYNDFGKVGLASYEDTGTTVLAMATADGTINETIPVILQGIVTNINWNWTIAGAPLWVDLAGELTLTDPHSVDNGRPVNVPVARVLSETSIIFEQGLGGKGETGPVGEVVGLGPASDVSPGIARLSLIASNPLDPIIIGDNDPRLSDSRPPDPHVHQAVDVSVTPYGTSIALNVQTSIEELDAAHVNKTGDIMTGDLILNADPTDPLGASTKRYVDALVSGLRWLDPICLVNIISDIQVAPPTTPATSDAYIVGSGGSGAWSGLDGHIVIWDGIDWLDRGLLASFTSTRRFGVSMESPTVSSGTFAGHEAHIAQWDPTLMTWSFYAPALNDAVWVCNELSLHAYHQYAYDGTHWVEFGGTSALSPGANLQLSGNILNVVDWSAGGTIDAATLQGSVPTDFALATELANYATATHNHDSTYASITHNHDVTYYNKATSDLTFAPIIHDHDGDYAPLAHDHTIPYDMSFFVAGNMLDVDMVVGSFVSTRDVSLADGLPNSLAFCRTPPAATTVYSLEVFGSGQLATITFSPGSNVGVIVNATGVILSTGDVLEILTPSIIDLGIKDVSITIVGCALAEECVPVGPPV